MAAIPAVNLGGGVTAASSISVGFYHACAIRLTDNGVVCWGRNLNGILGIDSLSDIGYPGAIALNDMTPINLGGSNYQAQVVVAGKENTAVIRDPDSSLIIWGDGYQGVLGKDDNVNYGDQTGHMENITPLTVLGRTEFDIVALGNQHVCARFKNYLTFTCWGRGSFGALGRDETTTVGATVGSMATLYEIQPNFVDLSYYTGTANPPEIATCAVGSNTLTAEQICTDNNAKNCETATDPTCRDMKVKKITSGYFHNCAIRSADSQVSRFHCPVTLRAC